MTKNKILRAKLRYAQMRARMNAVAYRRSVAKCKVIAAEMRKLQREAAASE